MHRLLQIWVQLRSSLWFLPAVIVLCAVLLAVAMIEVDSQTDLGLASHWPRLFGAGADGSRGMLEAIASSMITVAGVVFSITIVTLSLAASQYSSRVLRNFLRDRGNQAVLGVFLGVFAYCLVVLRTIRGGDADTFVPSLAVLGGVLLALIGIGFLIYFIHHISTSIQASHILAAIAADTLRAIEHLFPENLGAGEQDGVAPTEVEQTLRQHQWEPVPAPRSGYLVGIDTDALLRFACTRGTIVRMMHGIGEFVVAGTPIASLALQGDLDGAHDELNGCFALERQRTIEQDASFGVRQMVDIALKALSPGINDATTARMSVDHLASVLVRIAARRIPSPLRFHQGKLRVIARGPTFASLTREAFDEIRHCGEGDVSLFRHLVGRLETIASMTQSVERLSVLHEQLDAIEEAARRSIPEGRDRRELEKEIEGLAHRLLLRASGPRLETAAGRSLANAVRPH